jgi:hypothetical protein
MSTGANGYRSYVKYRDSILSDNFYYSLLRGIRVMAGEGPVAAIAVCRESGSTSAVQSIELMLDF